MRRLKYVTRRLALALLVVVGASMVTFFISRVVPSNPAAKWVGPHPTKEQLEKARIELGLDQPLHIQYLRYMEQVVRGDFGVSVRTHHAINDDLKTYLPPTIELVLAGMLLAVGIGIPLGVLSGAKKGRPIDGFCRLFAVAGVSIPSFWLALLLQLFFFGVLGILPLGGRVDNRIILYYPIQHITGLYILDSLLTGNLVAFKDSLLHIILPAFTLAIYPLGLTIRMTRSTMIEVLAEQYITAARAAGIPERTVLYRLALKNAIMPTLTLLGLSLVYALTGSILVEVIFSWPGLGNYLTGAIISIDFPTIIAVTLIVTVLYVLVNLFLDVLQSIVDPRVELS
jgi:peptide/nickel transport system permease protein